MRCNICGSEDFLDMGTRKSVRCATCNSLERTRVIGLFLQRDNLVDSHTRVLHLAPERGLADYLYGLAGANCTFADLDPTSYSGIPNMQKLDLCRDLDGMPDESFDLIIHSHVMEHLPCSLVYVLYQLHRLLSAQGRMVCCIPIAPGYFHDCSTSPELTDAGRTARFGQCDHVRRFGRQDLDMFLGKIYDLSEEYDLTRTFTEEELAECNIPASAWRGFNPSSVLSLGKNDYLLK